jgi:hypothetical protein
VVNQKARDLPMYSTLLVNKTCLPKVEDIMSRENQALEKKWNVLKSYILYSQEEWTNADLPYPCSSMYFVNGWPAAFGTMTNDE